MSATIQLSQIVLPEKRMRPLNPDNVAKIAESIVDQGLLNPITVRRVSKNKFRLVAGYHRFEAVKSLGETEIAAVVLPDQPSASLSDMFDELAEIDENLIRGELGYVLEGKHNAKRVAIKAAINAELKAVELRSKVAAEKAATGRVSDKTRMAVNRAIEQKARSYAENVRPVSDGNSVREVAKMTGQSVRTVQEKVAAHELLSGLCKEAGVEVVAVSGSRIDGQTELRKLKELARANRNAAVELVKAVASRKDAHEKASATATLAELGKTARDIDKDAKLKTDTGALREVRALVNDFIGRASSMTAKLTNAGCPEEAEIVAALIKQMRETNVRFFHSLSIRSSTDTPVPHTKDTEASRELNREIRKDRDVIAAKTAKMVELRAAKSAPSMGN